MNFEWDQNKARRNAEKHSITFDDAATVFGDPFALTFPDPDHSDGEDRFITFGLMANGEMVVVSHTDREDSIRIISARRMTRKEVEDYEKFR